jgi:PqqD family protein of HPr-rel-A system
MEIRIWRTLGDEPLRFRSWDGEYIVYSPFSGMTHRLDTAAGYLIECLIDGKKDTEVLCNNLSQHLGAEVDNDFRKSVDSVLDQLSNLGLVEFVSQD